MLPVRKAAPHVAMPQQQAEARQRTATRRQEAVPKEASSEEEEDRPESNLNLHIVTVIYHIKLIKQIQSHTISRLSCHEMHR